MNRILIAEPEDFSPEATAILSRVGRVELRTCNREEFANALKTYDVVWFRLAHRIDQALVEGARAKILVTPVTGLDHVDLDACRAAGLRVVSLKGETAFLKTVRATAELTIALSLALLRRLVPAALDVHQGRWRRDHFRGRELYGSTVGIVGVGRLGAIVAEYFSVFGMTVIGTDPRPASTSISMVSLDELLARADLVTVHVNYDSSTRYLIGERELALMKPNAVLVNTSRGGVINESALLAALERRTIAGAALDVLDGEPNVADHPLISYARDHDELLIVPHIGGNTFESLSKTEVFLATRVVEALGG